MARSSSTARKKTPKKKHWLATALVYLFVPLFIWLGAFVLWLYWDDIGRIFAKDATNQRNAPRASRKIEKSDKGAAAPRPAQEKILDDDRRKLDDILKQRQ